MRYLLKIRKGCFFKGTKYYAIDRAKRFYHDNGFIKFAGEDGKIVHAIAENAVVSITLVSDVRELDRLVKHL